MEDPAMMSGTDIAKTAQVQDRTFLPGRQGRRHLVEIDPIIATIKEYSPEWVLFDIPDSREANSVLRQLAKVDGIETSARANHAGGKKLYARYRPSR